MVITASLAEHGDPAFGVEYDDGIVKQTAEIPEDFGILFTTSVFDKRIPESEYLLLLEIRLRLRRNCPDDFMRMVHSQEFKTQCAALKGVPRQAFLLTLLQRAEELWDISDLVSAADPVAVFVNEECNRWLFEYWLSTVSREGRIYDFAWIYDTLTAMADESVQARYQYLENIIRECSEPIGCMFNDHRDKVSGPFILLTYPHNCTNRELLALMRLLGELKAGCEATAMKRSPEGTEPRAPQWLAKVSDRVLIIDALKHLRYMAGSDASVAAHLPTDRESGDPAKVHRNTRSKMVDGETHADVERLEQLIAYLTAKLADLRNRGY